MMLRRRVSPSRAYLRTSSPVTPRASQSVSSLSGGASAVATAGSSSVSLARIRSAIAPIGNQALVRRDERLVEDGRKRLAELTAGARDVRSDRPGLGEHVVLKAGVELHVTRLVDLLGGEVGGFLLAVGGHH